jgi:hypothetical protein
MNKGFLLVLMQPPPTLEEEFNAWYDTEHIAERLAVPGFETALRYVCIDGAPRYLAMYDLASPDVLKSSAYLKVGFGNASPWTKRVTSRVRIFVRGTGLSRHEADRGCFPRPGPQVPGASIRGPGHHHRRHAREFRIPSANPTGPGVRLRHGRGR